MNKKGALNSLFLRSNRALNWNLTPFIMTPFINFEADKSIFLSPMNRQFQKRAKVN